ncbi:MULTISPECIES: TetR/AcrR family transcriptional regulator [Streptomyces]|uniref:TetR/AcrR family transcriptional regulator n=1 Tax=Streptomyces TaxID=1883 RepID=UPI00048BC16D|nr:MULTISPECIES: TetR/AcrR family transcriptional regulator [unclassified Streptomyces]MYY19826.1 TetR family transcriptional regulator [Streptomyces sp. SID4912]SCD45517.1 transcriptional regulator, TetR family [Streptomyces sp. DpondAA-D4]SCE22117.1 transcriptional regulator, TetR family [Streptomyces sp. PpalLS-921]
MTEPSGRRERKKAATRQKIADTALRLFLERGYDTVGIRDVATEADVAVTTVFSHFASKEALVFERDQDFEQRLTRAVTDRPPHEPIIPALHREVHALVRHCTAEGSAPVRRMIEGSPALREYEESMSLRHAHALAAALSADPHLSRSTTACRATARFTIDAYALACRADDPGATVDEVFRMIKAAWEATAA